MVKLGIASFSIEDDLDNAAETAIEVIVTLASGQQRWCYFVTPRSLSNFGDRLPETHVRIHYGAPQMIVVDVITEAIIAEALHMIDEEGLIEKCTLPLD